LREIERNFSCRYGEIDIVSKHEKLIVFVEVRYRHSNSYGGGAASVDANKPRKLRNTAEYYLQQKRISNAACRFDVISVSGELDDPSLDWIQNAF
jgi:putative endonuclease